MTASYVVPVRQASALPPVPFRLFLTENALSVQLIVPLTGPIQDFHLQKFAPCRAHNVAATFRLRGLCNFLYHLSGDFQMQAKACDYKKFLKEPLDQITTLEKQAVIY
jgi:hypothetical protein